MNSRTREGLREGGVVLLMYALIGLPIVALVAWPVLQWIFPLPFFR